MRLTSSLSKCFYFLFCLIPYERMNDLRNLKNATSLQKKWTFQIVLPFIVWLCLEMKSSTAKWNFLLLVIIKYTLKRRCCYNTSRLWRALKTSNAVLQLFTNDMGTHNLKIKKGGNSSRKWVTRDIRRRPPPWLRGESNR